MKTDGPSGHWHTLESARSCPDQCLSPQVIASIEAAERRERVRANRCRHPDPCPILRQPALRCPVDATYGPDSCLRVWETGPDVTGHGPGWLKFVDHVFRLHHAWTHSV